MRLLRQATNAFLRYALAKLVVAPGDAIDGAFHCMRWVLKRLGMELPSPFIDEAVLKTFAEVMGRAIIDTEYGLPLRFQTPLIVTLATTAYCPFACTNCYSDSGDDRRAEMAGYSIRLFEMVAQSKVPFVLLTGGEPLAATVIREGLEILLSAGKLVYVSTNASINRALDLGARYSSRLAFVLPIWGARDVHNQRRGTGSFERLEANVAALAAHGLNIHLLVVLCDSDLAVFDTLCDLATRYPITTIRINRKVRIGRFDGGTVQISPDFAQALRRQIERLARLAAHVIIDVPEFRRARHRRLVQKLLGIPDFGSCSAGAWMMHLDAEAVAYPCFTFEGTSRFGIKPQPSFAAQWSLVQDIRFPLGDDDVCIGESNANTRR